MIKSSKWTNKTFNKKWFILFPRSFFLMTWHSHLNLQIFRTKHQSAFEFVLEFWFKWRVSLSPFLILRPIVLVADSPLSNCFSLLRKGNKDKIWAWLIAIVINRCCFKFNLFTHLDNIFPCSLINWLIKLMFLLSIWSPNPIGGKRLRKDHLDLK